LPVECVNESGVGPSRLLPDNFRIAPGGDDIHVSKDGIVILLAVERR
jgi:hypothetical protein